MGYEKILSTLRALIREPEPVHVGILPFKHAYEAGSAEDCFLGQRLLAEGRVGCLIVAGGQGTRLGFDGPKGMYPITVCQHKSIFQFLAEKVAAASLLAGRALPLALMTSEANDVTTRQYFIDHGFFGLQPGQLHFFKQEELPFLDPAGNPILQPDGSMTMGPDGNGGSLEAFCRAGIADAWKQSGVQFVNFIQIDNPLADPFDAELIGFHARREAEVTIKAVERKSSSERVGTIVQTSEGIRVVEYTELSEETRQEHRYANISCFCFSLEFVQRAEVVQWHKAWKKVPSGKEGWKFERFIFDVLPQASKIDVLVYDRARCFAPLKNASGEDSPEIVRKALIKADRSAYERVSGLSATDHLFEVHPQFYYPTDELIRRWKGRKVENAEIYLE